MVKIFAVGHRKIVDFPALAKLAKLFAFLQKSLQYIRSSDRIITFGLGKSLLILQGGVNRWQFAPFAERVHILETM